MEEVGILRLVIMRATIKQSFDAIGQMDPYVKINFATQIQQTQTHQGGDQTPEWNQTFEFRRGAQVSLNLEMYEEDTTSDDLIGKRTVSLAHTIETQQQVNSACDMILEGKMKAKLYFSVEFIPDKQADKIKKSEFQYQIFISNIYSMFSKQLAKFGADEPFLRFTLGMYQGNTTAVQCKNNESPIQENRIDILKTYFLLEIGKEPAWEDLIILNNNVEQEIKVDLFQQESATQQKNIGTGLINVERLPLLKPQTIQIYQNNVMIGEVYCLMEQISTFKAQEETKKDEFQLKETKPNGFSLSSDALAVLQAPGKMETLSHQPAPIQSAQEIEIEKIKKEQDLQKKKEEEELLQKQLELEEQKQKAEIKKQAEQQEAQKLADIQQKEEEETKKRNQIQMKEDEELKKQELQDKKQKEEQQQQQKLKLEQEMVAKKQQQEKAQLNNQGIRTSNDGPVNSSNQQGNNSVDAKKAEELQKKRQQQLEEEEENNKYLNEQIKPKDEREQRKRRQQQQKKRQKDEESRIAHEWHTQNYLDIQNRLNQNKKNRVRTPYVEEEEYLKRLQREEEEWRRRNRNLSVDFDPKTQQQHSLPKVETQTDLRGMSIERQQKQFPDIEKWQSSFTLQVKSIPAVSFPQSERFKDKQSDAIWGESYINLPSIFDKTQLQGAGIGYGQKSYLQCWEQKNSKEIPGPGTYLDLELHSIAGSPQSTKGFSFGLSRNDVKVMSMNPSRGLLEGIDSSAGGQKMSLKQVLAEKRGRNNYSVIERKISQPELSPSPSLSPNHSSLSPSPSIEQKIGYDQPSPVKGNASPQPKQLYNMGKYIDSPKQPQIKAYNNAPHIQLNIINTVQNNHNQKVTLK